MDGRKALVREFYEAFNRRDVEGMAARVHPQADFADLFDGGRVVGREALIVHWRRVLGLIRGELTLVSAKASSDGAFMVAFRHQITNPEGRLWDDGEETLRYEFLDGLISRMDRPDPR
ncbi:MAG: nuclear transport factor 2 family protein [Caulobacter sp.]|nr:nuclear transport factor 2 family protein [Caulobacter sp.]